MEVRLKDRFNKLTKNLATDLGRKNELSLPRVLKVVVNCGIGAFKDDKGLVESAINDITLITGQKPAKRLARKAISDFKLRKGEVVGLTVTLRGDRMWAFLDKLFSIVLPRVRDFRGVGRRSFDGKGNYSLGLREHTVFPEINPNTVDRIKSLEISIVTSARNDEEAFKLLSGLGMPFEKESK